MRKLRFSANRRRGKRNPNASITCEVLETRALLSVDVIFDFRFANDATLFNQQTLDTFAEVEATLESRLDDVLMPWSSSSLLFRNPSTGVTERAEQPIGMNEFRIFVGSRNIDGEGNVLALGSPSFSFDFQRDMMGMMGDHSGWGGSIALDNSEDWNSSVATPPSEDQVDLYSNLLHEVGHVLGIGSSSSQGTTAWIRHVDTTNATFGGPETNRIWGGRVPLENDLGHFKNNEFGPVGRETLFDPGISTGQRKTMTSLDWAALADIGWDINAATSIGLSIDQTSVSESGNSRATATVERLGGRTDTPEVVYLSAVENGTEVMFPASVEIPAGSRTTTFEITAVNDVIDDGDLSVTIQVESLRAENLSDQVELLVQDDDEPALPDLVLAEFNSPAALAAGDTAEIRWSVTNQGDSATGSFVVRHYVGLGSTFDPDNDLLLAENSVDSAAAGSTSDVRTTNVTLPGFGDTFYTGDGRYFLKSVVDADSQVEETDEANTTSAMVSLSETGSPPSFDNDGDRMYQPLTDGIVTIRYLASFRGETLIRDAVSENAVRNSPAAVETWLAELAPLAFDVDADGSSLALSDGILVLRYLAGFRGETLINDAVNMAGTRTNATEIEAFLQSYTQQGGVARGGGAGQGAANSFAAEQDEPAAATPSPGFTTRIGRNDLTFAGPMPAGSNEDVPSVFPEASATARATNGKTPSLSLQSQNDSANNNGATETEDLFAEWWLLPNLTNE